MPYSRHQQSLHALLDWWDKNNVTWYFFWGRGEGGGDGWFDLCKNVFSQTSGDRIFYHTACSIIHYEKYLFLVNDFFGDKVFPGITHITPPPPFPASKVAWSAIAIEFVHCNKTRQRFKGHVKCTVRVSTVRCQLCCEDIYCRYCIQKSNDVVPPMIYQHLL